MSLVMVERSFPEPVSFAQLKSTEEERATCYEIYGVSFLRTYVSGDGKRMACLFEAPDAESVRMLQARTGLPYDRVWAARAIRHQAAEPARAVVVEREFPEPVDEGALAELDGCRPLASYLALDGRRCISVFPVTDAPRCEGSWPATLHLR